MQHCFGSSEGEKGKAGQVFLVDNDAIGPREQWSIHLRQSERFGKCQRRLRAPRRHRSASALPFWRVRRYRWGLQGEWRGWRRDCRLDGLWLAYFPIAASLLLGHFISPLDSRRRGNRVFVRSAPTLRVGLTRATPA